MTDLFATLVGQRKPDLSAARLRKRYRAEARFRLYGIAAILLAVGILALLLGSIIATGFSAFTQTEIALDVHFDPAIIDPKGKRDPEVLATANYRKLARASLTRIFPNVKGRRSKRDLARLLSSGTNLTLRSLALAEPELVGTTQRIWIKSSADIDSFNKGQIPRDVAQSDRRVKDNQIAWFDALNEDGHVRRSFNTTLFTAGDSREPEQAGIWGAAVGSFLTLVVTLALSFPVGVLAATYLEAFAPKNRWTDLIEVNINNLAAVPSIVFGLLGLAVFLNFFGMPRSAPIVGGSFEQIRPFAG